MSGPPANFFTYREEKYWKGSQPVVGFAPSEMVKSLFSLEELTAIFGGYLEYEDTGGGQKYLGVWGDRKAGKFLQLLRNRGALVEKRDAAPGQFRQRHRASKSKISSRPG